MPCDGSENCCKIKGVDCPFLIRNHIDETGHLRKWACSLRAKHGNWDDVLADPDYKRVCENAWAPGINCRDWPEGPEEYRGCNLCGSCL